MSKRLLPRLLSLSGLVALLALPALAEPAKSRGPALVLPVDGTVVGRQVTVRIGFVGKGPHAPAEGTGINEPSQSSEEADIPSRAPSPSLAGPAEGTGLTASQERRPRGPHFAMLVDSPAPPPGTPFQADSKHIPFPTGLPQMTVYLPPGEHQLSLVMLNSEGAVSRRVLDNSPTSVIVK